MCKFSFLPKSGHFFYNNITTTMTECLNKQTLEEIQNVTAIENKGKKKSKEKREVKVQIKKRSKSPREKGNKSPKRNENPKRKWKK